MDDYLCCPPVWKQFETKEKFEEALSISINHFMSSFRSSNKYAGLPELAKEITYLTELQQEALEGDTSNIYMSS